MPGLSKVIVLDADARAGRQVQLGFEREGVPTALVAIEPPAFELPGEDLGLIVVGGVDGHALELVRRARALLVHHRIDAPIMFAGRGLRRSDAEAAGADEVVLQPAYLRDVVTIGRLLRGVPSGRRSHLVGHLLEITGVFTLVRALAALGRSATLTLTRGLRRGEIRFYHGEVTSAQVGMSHGQAALHQLLLWTDARFDFHHEDIVRRQQIPLSAAELFSDAERFLEGVRHSSGGLSPAVVLDQNLPRVQSLGKQIPTEVYGVLRMFDGHRVLADVLEDSAYRVFETLRVTQRAVEIGLLRAVDEQPRRATWRTVLALEDWLVGAVPRPGPADVPAAVAAQDTDATLRDSDTRETRDLKRKTTRKPRRKKKQRIETLPAAPPLVAPSGGIDWGVLVPRVIGAEVGPLSGVVPSAYVSGEIITAARPGGDERPIAQPTIVFDEAAELAREAAARAEAVARARAEALAQAAARAHAGMDVDADGTAPPSGGADGRGLPTVDPAAVTLLDAGAADASGATTMRITPAPDAAVVARGAADGEASGATTTKLESPRDTDVMDAVVPPGTDSEPTAPLRVTPLPSPVAAAARAEPAFLRAGEPAAHVEPSELAAEPVVPAVPAAPGEVVDEPSDGVIRDHIATAETAPVKRRRLPSDPPEDDGRPEVTAGEITTPQARAQAEPRPSEPTIYVADLAPPHAAPAPRGDAVEFSDTEEAFFRAGHDRDPAAPAAPSSESFDDLDEGYRPVGFWGRLRGKPTRRTDTPSGPIPAVAGQPDKPGDK